LRFVLQKKDSKVPKSYFNKVDQLKETGILQGFYSLNPIPRDNQNLENILDNMPKRGFLKTNNMNELERQLFNLLREEREYFSGMITKDDLGKIIELSNKQLSYKSKTKEFIRLVKVGIN